jgi:hypothetical protein
LVDKLLNSRLTAITPDTSISFDTWLTSVWSTVTGYTVPAIAAIKVDTKFGSGKGFFNFIIIEEMPKTITPQVIGNKRYVNSEVKRIQIMCIGTTAKVTKYNMEKHIESLVNGNPTAMQSTYGIDSITLSSFNEIQTAETDDTITNMQPNTGFQKARSAATITLRFESESVTI